VLSCITHHTALWYCVTFVSRWHPAVFIVVSSEHNTTISDAFWFYFYVELDGTPQTILRHLRWIMQKVCFVKMFVKWSGVCHLINSISRILEFIL
jgi:hypothetical protein